MMDRNGEFINTEQGISEILVSLHGSFNQKHELISKNFRFGTLLLPWHDFPRFIDTNNETWIIHDEHEEIVIKGKDGNNLLIARLLDTYPIRARIVFTHHGYRLEPASNDPWSIYHNLVSDLNKNLLTITNQDRTIPVTKIVIYQSTTTLLIAFAYYTVFWLRNFIPFCMHASIS